MTQWNHVVELKEDFKAAAEYEIAPCQLSERVVTKLLELQQNFDPNTEAADELKIIISNFQSLVKYEELTEAEFNSAWTIFYDWADCYRVWVTVY